MTTDAISMRLICAPCGVTSALDAASSTNTTTAAAAEATGAEGNACDKCGAALTRPTVFDCARLGMLPELQQLIQENPTFGVNALEPSSQATLLHHAAINSKMRILEYLATQFGGRDAAGRGDTLDVDALGGTELQTTPLFWAAYHNHIYAVELLLRLGADPTFRDDAGFCAFLVAIQRCFPILAAYLVAKGTDIDTRVQDDVQRTALMLLCQRQRFHLDSFRMVLSLGADVDAQDAQGNTALHHAVANDLGLAVKMLLDKHASRTVVNLENKTPLDLARGLLDDRSLARHLLEEDQQLQQLAAWTPWVRRQWLDDNLYKLSFLVPWLVIPACAWILSSTEGVSMIFLKQSLLLVAALGFLKIVQRGTYGDKRKAAALLFGINIASVFWLVVCLPRLCDDASVSITFQTVMYSSVVLLLVCLYKTATTDAGTVFTTYREKIHNIRTLVESKSPSATKLCLTCLHKRPLRAKHCAELNACIAKFDHYCPFVVNAVGAQNHHYFVGFLLFAVVAIGMELLVCWWFLVAQQEGIVWGYGVVAFLWSLVHFQPVLLCVVVLAAIHMAWIGYLLGFHVYLLCAALTTNEVVKHENLERVYSRGIVNNIVDFFHLPGGKPVDWTAMFRLDDFTAVTMDAATKKKEM